MPNPLTSVISASPAAKPDARPLVQRDPNGAASFQMVMDHEADQQTGELDTAELQVQEPDPELEEPVAEVGSMEIVVSADNPPPVNVHGVTSEAAVGKQKRQPSLSNNPVRADEFDARSDTPRAEATKSQHDPIQRPASPAFQALVFGSVPPTGKFQSISNPQNKPVAPSAVDSRTKEMSELSASIGPERDARQIPPTPDPAPKPPPLSERAPAWAQMQLLASEKASTKTKTMMVSEIEDAAIGEAPTSCPTRETGPTFQSLTSLARAETARAIAGQMASAISARPQSGSIEIALNPEELGRVSIVLNGRDDGLHMTIAAERPETLDMMRRHLSVLETEFQNLGLGDLSIDLGTSPDAQRDEADTNGDSPLSAPSPENATEAVPTLPQLSPDGRIDMRL